ncbi:MAG TPA: hypothetical protein ENH26_00675 [Candidatus Wolfebacteria bacterium]|nr:hypothetical protein [Candidatus Wolfebacteria bacterium]
MLNQKSKILILAIVIAIVIVNVSIAQAGLVPCGTSTTNPCTWCDLGQLIANIIDFLVKIAIVIAVVFIVWGGFIIMTAGGSPERAKNGRDIIKSAVIGIIITLGAWLIINTVIKLVLQADIGPWNQISC